MQRSEEMYRFDIKEISKENALKMIQKYHYSNTFPKLNKYFLGFYNLSESWVIIMKDMEIERWKRNIIRNKEK